MYTTIVHFHIIFSTFCLDFLLLKAAVRGPSVVVDSSRLHDASGCSLQGGRGRGRARCEGEGGGVMPLLCVCRLRGKGMR